jgi:hypothetical protein
MTQLEMDRLFDALAALIDRTPAAQRERVLARLVIALAHEVDDYAAVRAAIDRSGSEPN